MGLTNGKNTLPPHIQEKALKVFRQIDVDGSKTIDKEETLKFWKSNYAKICTDELFKSVDIDNNGEISEDEWVKFWGAIKEQGRTDEEIEEELDQLLEGLSWVQFDKYKKPKK